jgi:hypothetical protein
VSLCHSMTLWITSESMMMTSVKIIDLVTHSVEAMGVIFRRSTNINTCK